MGSSSTTYDRAVAEHHSRRRAQAAQQRRDTAGNARADAVVDRWGVAIAKTNGNVKAALALMDDDGPEELTTDDLA